MSEKKRQRAGQLPIRKTSEQETVLLIEDEQTELLLCQRVLERNGYRVLCASSGQEARACFSAPFQLAIFDVVLPDVSGIDLMNEMAEKRDDVISIVRSSDQSFATIKRSLDLGAFWYLRKPTDSEELLAIVRRAFDSGIERRERIAVVEAFQLMMRNQRTTRPADEDLIMRLALARYVEEQTAPLHIAPLLQGLTPAKGLTLEEIKKRAIIETLIECGGNKARAAKRLGISEKTIYNNIASLNINADPGPGSVSAINEGDE